MSDINPRIVDGGEPICDSDCPCYPRAMGERRCHADRRETVAGAACVEAIRRQRDEAKKTVAEFDAMRWRLIAERDEARRELCRIGKNEYGEDSELHAAASRGWSYLYADARDGGRNGNSD